MCAISTLFWTFVFKVFWIVYFKCIVGWRRQWESKFFYFKFCNIGLGGGGAKDRLHFYFLVWELQIYCFRGSKFQYNWSEYKKRHFNNNDYYYYYYYYYYDSNNVKNVLTGTTESNSNSLRKYLSNIHGWHEIKELQKNSQIWHCTDTAGSADVKVQKNLTCEITLHVAQTVNTEQLQHCIA